MWPFHQCKEPMLFEENTKLRHEIKDLKKLVDELFAREHEAKAVFNYTVHDKEKRIVELENKVTDLEDTVEGYRIIGKNTKKGKYGKN